MKWLARKLAAALRPYVDRVRDEYEPDVVLENDVRVYLKRWELWSSWLCTVFIHEFVSDDLDQAPHDHHSFSMSLVLAGESLEVQYERDGTIKRFDRIEAPTLRFRGARFLHKILRPEGENMVTIFVIGPRIREWGFHCGRRGWRSHREYLSKDHDASFKGRGCD